MIWILSDAALSTMRKHAEDRYPEECCGILIGHSGHVERAIPTGNIASLADRPTRYTIAPLAIVRATREASQTGESVIGFFHSHPDHPAEPSKSDIAEAWESYVYVIIEVRDGKATRVNAWDLASVAH